MFILLIMLCPWMVLAQEPPYPKDTIYIQYENKENTKKWPGKFERKYKGISGIYFNVKQKSGDMALFHSYEKPSDTLSVGDLKNYTSSNLKEINKKRREWIFDHNRPPMDRNGIFQTYLIEVISDSKIVKYPVIWRNEGTTP